MRETFTVRKQSFGVGVERTFPLHSPKIERIDVAARGDVRRAKLYYLREKIGKRARIRERREPIGGGAMTRSRSAVETAAEEAGLTEVEPEDEPVVDEALEESAEAEAAEEPVAAAESADE